MKGESGNEIVFEEEGIKRKRLSGYLERQMGFVVSQCDQDWVYECEKKQLKGWQENKSICQRWNKL